jgi:hypothetical protein
MRYLLIVLALLGSVSAAYAGKTAPSSNATDQAQTNSHQGNDEGQAGTTGGCRGGQGSSC